MVTFLICKQTSHTLSLVLLSLFPRNRWWTQYDIISQLIIKECVCLRILFPLIHVAAILLADICVEIQPRPKLIVFWKSLPEAPVRAVPDLTAVSLPLLARSQHLSSPESTERAVWIRYALRTMVSLLAQTVFWHALLTAAKTSTLKGRSCGDLQEEKEKVSVCL